MTTRRAALALALATPAVSTARAQGAWRPDRPVRVVVPFAPGGATDVLARALSEPLGAVLGQPIVIENRAGGAAGLIGSDAVAKSPPDGHTVLLHSNAHVIAPSLVARMPYDVLADFAAVAHLGRVPQVLVVNTRLPITDMASLLVWLRANSGRINFASAGIGSGNHLASEIFRAADARDRDGDGAVPRRRAGHAGGDRGRCAYVHRPGLLGAQPHPWRHGARGRRRRGDAHPGAARRASASEAGLPAWDAAPGFGAFVPARTPPAAVTALNAACNAAMARIGPRLADLAVEPQPQLATPAAFDAFVRADLLQVAEVPRKAGVRPE